MKRVLHKMQSLIAGSSFALMVSLGIGSAAYAQVDVTATGGTPTASYTTLKGAFDAINAGTHQGAIVVGISANTTETAPAVLNSSGAGTAIYTSVLIQPTVDGVSISGATTTGRGLIELKGADDVTINGDNPNTAGTNRNLTIVNTAANTVTYTSVIRIATAATVVTSADNIAITNCILNGNATGRNASGNTSTTGSENTTFGIYVGGNGGATSTDAPSAITSVTTNTAPTGTTVNSLVVSNNTVNAVARGIVFNGAGAAVSTGVTITNNLVGDQATVLAGSPPYTSPATTVYTKGIYIAGTTSLTITGNTIKNIMSYVATATNAIEMNAAIGATGGTLNVSNNTIAGVVTNTTGSAAANGIIFSAAAISFTIANNNVSSIQTIGSASAAGILTNSGAGGVIENNKVSYVYARSTGGYSARGIVVNAGSNITIQNNMIWDLNAANNNSTTSTVFAVKGIALAAGSDHKVYHNSVHLYGAMLPSGATADNTTCLVITSASSTGIDVRNNIFVNKMTGPAATVHACIQLPSGATSSMNLTINNNAYITGAAANSYYGITQSTFAGFTTPLAMRAYTSTLSAAGTNDNLSFGNTGAAPFISPTDLHVPAAVLTQLESGGASVGVTSDIDGQLRPGPAGSVNGGALAPDMGADEFDGMPMLPPTITLNSVTPPVTPQCTAAARLVSVNVSNVSGTVAAVNLAYSFNGTPQTPIAMTNTSGTTWEATIPVPTPANATVSWAVAATNSFALTGTYTGTSYTDEPTLGATASVTASSSNVCSGSPTTLTAKIVKPGAVTIGTATTLTGATSQPTAFCNRWSSYRMQTVYTAAELTAAGLQPGNITAITYTIATMGDGPATNANYTVKIGTTALTALTDFVATGSFTTVFPAATYTRAVGQNTVTFVTPYNWDGTSNIIIEVSHDGANLTNNAQTFYTATPGNTVAWSTNGGATGTPSPNRLNITFSGNALAPISSISWSDGSTTIGTTNPLVVNPTSATTYTATLETAGCAVAPSPSTTVTVTALPSAPTAANSAQCGSQVPTASVTSTTGLPTPTFNWYAAASGGSPLQSSTSTTYTSVVTTTTTFYVSELNTVTGCESARTAVLVSVSSADPIAAVASPTTVCPGESFTLTASNTAGTPVQNYSYTFESATTGSGAETPVAGNPVTITPTASGTMVYTVNGLDGGCAATNTVSVVVKAVPAITAVSATPATVCSGDQINLSAAVLPPNGGTATLGTQTTTEFGGGVYRNGFGTGDFRHQLLYTAAEMTAAGFTAGDITALAFNVTSAGSGSANNYTIRLANTAVTGPLNATFQTGTFTTVYTAATYTAVAGINSHVFQTPFAWDGTSNILVDICYNISSIGSSSTLAATTPAQIMNTNLLGSAGACAAAGGAATYANRPLIRFTMNSNAGYTWSWAPGAGLNTSSATTSIVNNTGSPISQAFTVTATSLSTGCTNSETTAAVTINSATVAPVATNSTQCGPGVPTASVTGTGTPGNTFQWFTVPTGGTAIAGETGSTLSGYTVSATTTFYVSEYNGSCPSPRTPVTVTVTPAPAVSIAGSANLCIGSSESLTASSSNDPNYTYSWSGGLGTGATVTAAPTVTTTYTVSAVDMSGGANNGCNTSATITITVNPVPTGVTASASDNTICNGEGVMLTSGPSLTPVSLLTQNFDSGFGAWTTTYSGTAPVATQWLVQNAPFTYDGSMDFTGFATAQGGGFAMTNGDLGASGLRTRAALQSPSFSTVGMNSATLTFENLYQRWASGDSAVAVQVSINGGSTWTNLKEYFAIGTDQGTITNNAQVPANESITLGAGLMNQPDVRLRFNYVSSWGYYWLIDNVQLTGTPAPLTYAWTSSPAGYASSAQNPPAPVTPAVTTTYTMTATNSFGCTASASTTVTVNQPTTSSTSATACASYTWTNGTTYTTSGTYTQTLTNAVGCDSVATLVLTINNPTTSTTTASACEEYTWTNGTTYTTSGTYTQTLTNSVGCDSVATLVLTINQPTTSSTSITACNSYTWTDGNTYNTSGTYTQTLTNANGCDSIATLVLTITTTVTSSTSITACDSYTWTDGNTYNTSGTYTQTLTTAQGCDSIATLVLTINNSTTSTTTATACESYTWTDGTTYTTSGTYTQTLTNAAGCDSIATLVLTINNATSSTTTASACEEYTWTDGNTYTTSGTYTQTLTNANGCDSIATLVLTITGNPTATATDNGDLTITASAGTSYQWVHCATGLPIAGATSQTYTATVNGDYAVVVTNAGGCSDTSNCVTIDNIGINELVDASIKVFPNPTSGDVYVTMTAASATIDVMDAQGKLLQTVTVQNGEKVQLSTYETGVYFLRIATENGSAVERIVKN